MTNNQLIAMLQKHKDAPELGGAASVSHDAAAWARLSREIGSDAKLERTAYSMVDYLQYLNYQFSHVLLKPMSVGFSAVMLIFGSWVATVNASFDSVPGDVLYPVKLATEHAQITLSTSGEQRAKLHAEFAGRRLDEMNAITSSNAEGKDEKVKAAVDGFKLEIASVNDELMNVQISDPGQAAALAIVVGQKTDEYQATIAQSEPQVSDANKGDVAGAVAAAQGSGAQALNTIVASNEANEQPVTTESLQKSFQAKLKDLNTRIALSIGRLAVIEGVLAKRTSVNPTFADRIKDAKLDASAHEDEIQKAMEAFASGGFRKSFDLLAQIDTDVTHSEDIITELEIDITTGA
ncbi:MAG: DUF5667 domain-containing protein [Candidatus Uhrbacteria bacterium]